MLPATLGLTGCVMMAAMAEDQPRGVAPPPARTVEKVDDDHCLVGGISLRKSTRGISFDGAINQDGGLIKFLLVTEKGKLHEPLFTCSIRPTAQNLAFKLLGFPSSPELFEVVGPDHRPTGKHPEVPVQVRAVLHDPANPVANLLYSDKAAAAQPLAQHPAVNTIVDTK